MRLSIVAAALAFLAIPTLASAHAGNNDPNVVHACVHAANSNVRIVGVTGSCNPAETPAHWSIQGPPGTNGINGTDGKDATHPDPPCFDNTNRYVNCGNGTVTDTVTGLIWLQQVDCLPDATYAAANQAAAALKDGDCGGTLTDKSSPGDWRLPTMDEWIATMAPAVASGCHGAAGPAVTNDTGTGCHLTGDGSSFVALSSLQGDIWSSTARRGDNAHITTANGGQDNSIKTQVMQAWPVRGGRR